MRPGLVLLYAWRWGGMIHHDAPDAMRILETFFAESCLGRSLGFSQRQDGSSSSDE